MINIKKVKQILDEADFDYEFSHSAGKDIDKAINYLNKQRFSLRKISEHLPELDAYDNLCSCELAEKEREVAEYVCHSIAQDKIEPYICNRKKPNGWTIDESVTFKLN